MKTKFNIDVAKMVEVIRSFGSAPNLFSDSIQGALKTGEPNRIQLLIEAAKKLTPHFTGNGEWCGDLHFRNINFFYMGFLHQTDPIFRLAVGIAALCDRPDSVARIVRGEIEVISPVSTEEPTYIYVMRTTLETERPAALGFENVYIIEFPPVELWAEGGFEWILEDTDVQMSAATTKEGRTQ